MLPFRTQKALGKLRESVGSLAGRTASAARGLGASVGRTASAARESARGLGASAFRSIGLYGHHLDHRKLVPVPEDIHKNFDLRENSAKRLYNLEETTGNLYERSSEYLGPVGHLRDQTDERTARFLPEHMPKKDETWAIVNRM
jgi:hypothetical protein